MVASKVVTDDSKGYMWLAAQLREGILAGEIPAGESLPAVKFLGKKYGTSPETARRAAKQLQSEGLVSSQPRQGFRVLARVNDPDKGLPIAFVVDDSGQPGAWDEFYRHLFAGLQSAAGERHWPMLALGSAGRSGRQIMEQLRDCRACGIVLDATQPELTKAVSGMGMPMVMMDSWQPAMQLDAVVQDSFQGAMLAVQHLLDRGHTRIAWLGKIAESSQSQERFGGFCAALAAKGISVRAEWQRDTPPEKTAVNARKLLSGRDRPTGVVGLWHAEAAELAHAANELGLKQGKDIDLVGWSAAELYATEYRARFSGVALPPTMVWSIAELARATIARLAERRLNPTLPTTLIKIPTRLRMPE